jgi:hypothetical protein
VIAWYQLSAKEWPTIFTEEMPIKDKEMCTLTLSEFRLLPDTMDVSSPSDMRTQPYEDRAYALSFEQE